MTAQALASALRCVFEAVVRSRQSGARAVSLSDLECTDCFIIDAVEAIYAAFPLGQYHVMVDAHDVEAMPILAGAFGRESMARLRDKDREVNCNAAPHQ